MKKVIAIALFISLAAFAAACSKTDNSPTPSRNSTSTATNNNAAAGASSHGAADSNAPPSVRAAFPDAQSFTKQHKDIPASQIASIEKESGGKVPDTDHHSYLAFSSSGGARRQIGAATVVNAGGKELVVVYENREGKPYIKEVRADGVAPAFLDQFKGKGHDDKFQVGADLKAQGVDESTAKAIASAIHIDILTMQTLYGGPDTH